MTYYPTLAEDLQRAKEILEAGKPSVEELSDLNRFEEPVRSQLIDNFGTIYGKDICAAYKLLESFVAEIERLQGALQQIMQTLGPRVPGNVDYTVKWNAAGLVAEQDEALRILREAGIEYKPRKAAKP
jgi:hypothetical protein